MDAARRIENTSTIHMIEHHAADAGWVVRVLRMCAPSSIQLPWNMMSWMGHAATKKEELCRICTQEFSNSSDLEWLKAARSRNSRGSPPHRRSRYRPCSQCSTLPFCMRTTSAKNQNCERKNSTSARMVRCYKRVCFISSLPSKFGLDWLASGSIRRPPYIK